MITGELHTPLPWFVNQCGIYSENPKAEKPGTPMGHALIASTGDEGDEYEGHEQLANAVFIVKAVNLHDELVRVLTNIVSWHDGTNEREFIPMGKCLAEARLLLAKNKENHVPQDSA